jgi:hypothetical protein
MQIKLSKMFCFFVITFPSNEVACFIAAVVVATHPGLRGKTKERSTSQQQQRQRLLADWRVTNLENV